MADSNTLLSFIAQRYTGALEDVVTATVLISATGCRRVGRWNGTANEMGRCSTQALGMILETPTPENEKWAV